MSPINPTRAWIVGFGVVGQWVARALAAMQGPAISVVGVASARDGFVYDPDGVDLAAALRLRGEGRRLAELPGVAHFDTALEGMRATDADVLVEVGLSPPSDGQPGLDHMREAIGRGIAVVASNKWPVAIAGAELVAMARDRGVVFRAESTVMSGTPVLASLSEGLAGARPLSLRGVLNATNNFILTRMGAGAPYEEALSEAQELGIAEPDPSADVDGLDTASKLMVLSALLFGEPLSLDAIELRGISVLEPDECARAAENGLVMREVATLTDMGNGAPMARVAPEAVDPKDPLGAVEGTQNVIVCEADRLGEVAIRGPGAGRELAGWGVLADLLAVARERERAGLRDR